MNKIVLWTPRIISAIIIVFASILAFEGFVPGTRGIDNTLALLIGLLPAVIFVLALVLAWFFKLAGGITYAVLGIAMTVFFQQYQRELTFLSLSSPVLVVGVLFVLSHFYEKSSSTSTDTK